MKASSKQSELIDNLTREMTWWKHCNDISKQGKLISEFVEHELNDLDHEQKALLSNGLNAILSVIKRVE